VIATHILLVEDDRATRQMLAAALREEGFEVSVAERGAAADRALAQGDITAVILDVGLPDGSGVDLCRRWRRGGLGIPVLMLTARTDVASRVGGLDAGADDYLGKPFSLAELKARLRALLRRRRPEAGREKVLSLGPVLVDFGRRQAWLSGLEVPITRRESEVLERLAAGRGRAVSRDDLLEELWGEATRASAASLEVIVARLRRKLERPGRPLIRTVRGHGYALAGQAEGSRS
jgi:DNA-binding response OmpR family regulator